MWSYAYVLDVRANFMTVSNASIKWFNDVRADYRVHRNKTVTCSEHNLTITELNEILQAASYARYLELRQRQIDSARRLYGGQR
jgi:hypothetical protein